MALAVDGFRVLRAMADHASLFAEVRTDANKQATALFSKQIKKAGLDNVRAIYKAIGEDDFRKMVDVLTGIGPLLKRLDKHNPELKTMSAHQQRELLNDLSSSDTQPTDQPAKVLRAKPLKVEKPKAAKGKKPPKRPEKKQEPGIMDLRSMRVRDREKE